MKYYQEITLLDSNQLFFFELWSKLYTQLHIALADIKNQHGIDTIGVSFPRYKFEEKSNNNNEKGFATLGTKLRVFAHDEADLQLLNLSKFLEQLSDYVHIRSISEVGNKATTLLIVKRYRFKDVNKQAREFAKYKCISFEEALLHCKMYKRTNKSYPFINLKSQSTEQLYKLSVCQTHTDNQQNGSFNAYGMNNNSGVATIPHWDSLDIRGSGSGRA